MVVADTDALVADLRSVAGEGLRSVATYDEDGYDLLYLRAGLENRAQNVADDIHENLVLEGIGADHLEDLFAAGDLEYTLHEFEEMQAYHFAAGQFVGVFVSADPDAAVGTADVKAVVHEHLESR